MRLNREKHLDHMVRVVPLIVLGYALQCYVIMRMNSSIGSTCLMLLGVCLVGMISTFITYDIKHHVEFFDDRFQIDFLGNKTVVYYSEVKTITHTDSIHSFAQLTFQCHKMKFTFYFVDEADKIKAFVEEKQKVLDLAA